jgi:anti-anti-sigma factor
VSIDQVKAVQKAAAALKHCTVNIGDDSSAGGLVIRLTGHLDGEAAGIIMEPLVDLIEAWDGGRNVVVDLARLEYVASLGIGMITTMAVAARRRGIEYALQAPQPSVLKVLELLGIPQFIPIRAGDEGDA